MTDHEGRILEEDFSDIKDAISSYTARIMTSMLREVAVRHRGRRCQDALILWQARWGSPTISPTPGSLDFLCSLTCGVWIGYDEKKSLGDKETGGHAALPIWIQFMNTALAGKDPGEFQGAPSWRRNGGCKEGRHTRRSAQGDGELH